MECILTDGRTQETHILSKEEFDKRFPKEQWRLLGEFVPEKSSEQDENISFRDGHLSISK